MSSHGIQSLEKGNDNMLKKIGFIIDPIESLKPQKDSSLYLMRGAFERGYEIYIIDTNDIFMQQAEPRAFVWQLKNLNDDLMTPAHDAMQEMSLTDFDVILMRKDPPFNMQYIYVTYMLERAEQAGVRILNKPQSVRDCNEKFFITHFPQCIADTIISAKPQIVLKFLKQHQKIVLKALDSMGGDSVFLIEQCQFNDDQAAIEYLQKMINEYGFIMAQRFLPEIVDGDRRITLINGEPLPYAVVRLAKEGEFRANLAQGADFKIEPLSKRDLWLCEQIKGEIKARDLHFVGIDVIGDYITEINDTCPTCLVELDKNSDIDPGKIFWDSLDLRR